MRRVLVRQRGIASPVRLRERRMWDFNDLLQLGVITAFASSVVLYRSIGAEQTLVTPSTLAVTLLLCIETSLLLRYERHHRDPFLLLLLFVVIFFYVGRVPTLLIFPDSTEILNRVSAVAPDQLRSTLLFVAASVLAMFIGLLPFRTPRALGHGRRRALFGINPLLLAGSFVISIASSTYFTNVIGLGRSGFSGYSRIESYVNMLIDPSVMLILAAAFLFAGAPALVRRYRLLIGIVVGLYFLSRIASGSRGGLFSIFLAFTFASLAAYKRLAIPRKWAILGIFAGLPLATAAFAFGSIWRNVFNAAVPATEAMKVELGAYTLAFHDRLNGTLSALAMRLGFLDFAANLIAHRTEYSVIINPVYYFKSIVDTGYTPGFDVFGVIRAAQALSTVYAQVTMDVAREFYNTDQMTVFGECYLLFGYIGALVIMLLASAVFKWCYAAISFREADTTCVARSLVLYIYFNFWLNSFGLDWLVIFVPRLILSAGLFMMLLRIGRKRLERVPEPGRA